MMYSNGIIAKLGDTVQLWNGKHGVIVCSLDTNEFTSNYPKSEWDYLKQGLLIKVDNGELFHYAEADEDIELVSRANAKAA